MFTDCIHSGVLPADFNLHKVVPGDSQHAIQVQQIRDQRKPTKKAIKIKRGRLQDDIKYWISIALSALRPC